jgi:hypothetical protein
VYGSLEGMLLVTRDQRPQPMKSPPLHGRATLGTRPLTCGPPGPFKTWTLTARVSGLELEVWN